jgi:nicotinate-nucleotide adenylyltransferase
LPLAGTHAKDVHTLGATTGRLVVRQLGVFCGTFNPVHLGHLLIAEFAYDQFQLDKVLFIPSPKPPHKVKDILDKESRYAMVLAAIEGNDHFEASRIEMDREGPSYTVDTLSQLKKTYGDETQLNLIVGQDNLKYLHEWHDSPRLFTLCRILVAARAPDPESTQATDERMVPNGANVNLIVFPDFPVSSSAVRSRLRAGQTVLYMVPPKVNDLLKEKRHYVQ